MSHQSRVPTRTGIPGKMRRHSIKKQNIKNILEKWEKNTVKALEFCQCRKVETMQRIIHSLIFLLLFPISCVNKHETVFF